MFQAKESSFCLAERGVGRQPRARPPAMALCSEIGVGWARAGSLIISRTPLRVSFVGAGTDMAVFYRRYGGAVISTSINRYVYVTGRKGLREAHAALLDYIVMQTSCARMQDAGGVVRAVQPKLRSHGRSGAIFCRTQDGR